MLTCIYSVRIHIRNIYVLFKYYNWLYFQHKMFTVSNTGLTLGHRGIVLESHNSFNQKSSRRDITRVTQTDHTTNIIYLSHIINNVSANLNLYF